MPTDDILWRKVDSLKGQEVERPNAFSPEPQQPSHEAVTSLNPPQEQAPMPARRPEAKPSRREGSDHASSPASMLATYPAEWIETTRRVVKSTGKEITFARLTPQEKAQLTDAVYGLRRQGMRMSENAVLRIAISLLLEDHKANGKHSFLQKVIAALLA